jgi:hypothetical protein
MSLITKAQRTQLVKNFNENQININRDGHTKDFKPVVKFFNPCGAGTWLISELDPETNIAFGLCDLGMGFPELGDVSLDELKSIRLPFGLSIERDAWFEANKTLNEYADEARSKGCIAA